MEQESLMQMIEMFKMMTNIVDVKPQSSEETVPFVSHEKYFIHDNGGRPFKVIKSTNNLDIFTYDVNIGIPVDSDYKLIKSYRKLTKIFLPTDGNTILAHISGNKYVCIEASIYEFEINDTILEYHSIIGNSDVPYPLAIGKKNVFFLLIGEYASKEHFEGFPTDYNWGEYGYNCLWGQYPFKKKVTTHKIKKTKTICKRLY
jgi:hypothetical protein